MTKMKNYRTWIIRGILLLVGAAFLAAGLLQGGFSDVMKKAVMICYECIGIG